LSDPFDPASEAGRVDFVAGEVHCLIAFALALAATHPNRAALRTQFEKAKEVAVAIAEPQMISESFLEGLEDVARRLNAALKGEGEFGGVPRN
jgi:hypothetical protein